MKLKIEITEEQEDALVAASLLRSYERIAGSKNYGTPEQYLAALSALGIIYHYYTGQSIK